MDHAYTQLASRTTQGAAAVRVTVDGVYGNQRLDKREKRVNGQSGAGGVASRVFPLLLTLDFSLTSLHS
jgi:hypothetical protein